MENENHQVAQATKKPRKIKKFFKVITSRWFIAILLIIALAAAGFLGYKWHQSNYKANHPDAVTQAQTNELISRVGKLAILPADETPTVATISDVSKLAGQTFFAKAQNGDKVLIYSKAKEAVLYRPTTDQIVNIAPLNVNNP